MKIIVKNDNETMEEVKHFILIKLNVPHPPFIGTVMHNIDDEYFVPYILGDHSKWEFERRN